jgi:hypothetical protein
MIRIGSKHEFSKSTGFLVSIRITLSGAQGGISTRVLSLTVGALSSAELQGPATWSFCDDLNANHASTGRALCRLSYSRGPRRQVFVVGVENIQPQARHAAGRLRLPPRDQARSYASSLAAGRDPQHSLRARRLALRHPQLAPSLRSLSTCRSAARRRHPARRMEPLQPKTRITGCYLARITCCYLTMCNFSGISM